MTGQPLADAFALAMNTPESPFVFVGHLSPAARHDVVEHVNGKAEPPPASTYRMEPGEAWRCFHCGAKLKTMEGARLHFGCTPMDEPLCLEAFTMLKDLATRPTPDLDAMTIDEAFSAANDMDTLVTWARDLMETRSAKPSEATS